MSESVQCTECSEPFSTETGMKIHRTAVHGPVDHVTLICEGCGDEYSVKESKADGRRFCETDCAVHNLHKTREYSRSEEPRPSYGSEWPLVRDRCLKRDDHRCQSCGVDEDELQNSLHVHHIRPLRDHEDRSKANRLENLVSLCKSCHYEWEGIPIRPYLIE